MITTKVRWIAVMLTWVIISDMSCFAAKTDKGNEPKLLSTFNSWKAYEISESGKKVCYMVTSPQSQKGEYKKRGDVCLMVTHRPAASSLNVISHSAGYPFTKGQEVIMTITGKNNKQDFTLFTEGETAWGPDSHTDNDIVRIITGWGSEMVVKGVSSKGVKTTDTYSLKGAFQAYQAINKACGIK
jgi:hypothetical protein